MGWKRCLAVGLSGILCLAAQTALAAEGPPPGYSGTILTVNAPLLSLQLPWASLQ